MRASADILQDDDKQLYEKFNDDEAAEFWLEWIDDLGNFIESQKAGIDILEASRSRLLICAARYGKEHCLIDD